MPSQRHKLGWQFRGRTKYLISASREGFWEEAQFGLNHKGWVRLRTMRTKGVSERRNVVSKDLEMESPRHGTIGQPSGERAGVYPRDFCKSIQVLKRRMMWIELSVRKLNLIVHWERTRSGCVFIDICLLKKRGHVKEWGYSTQWTVNSGGRAAWREWEMGGEAAQGRGNSFFHLTHAYMLFPSVYILFYKICVGPFQHCLGYS